MMISTRKQGNRIFSVKTGVCNPYPYDDTKNER
jgi:hypothetical protein